MVDMKLYEQIRHLYSVEKLSQRSIARKLGISRNTVKRYCKGDNVPWESTPRKYNSPVTKPIENIVIQWLEEDKQAPNKQRHTAERIHQRLQEEHGFTGGQSTIRKLVKELRQQDIKAHVPLEFDPGEVAQVDWGEAVIYLNGKKSHVQLFCYRLCNSAAPYVAAFPSQRSDCFLAGHVQAFRFFGGVPRRLVYDNLRTAVREGWGRYVKSEQPAFVALKSHYAFRSDYCNLASGNEKGLVEGLVGYIRRNVLVPVPRVDSMAELQQQFDKRCLKYQDKHLRYHDRPVKEALALEQQHFTSLPGREFDYALTTTADVDSLSMVKFDRNRYSVPVSLAGKTVTVKGYPFEVKIHYQSQQVAVHPRSYQRDKTSLELEHYLPILVKKPRSLQNAAPLRRALLPPCILKLKERLLAQGEDRELAQILGLIIGHGIEEVESAIILALENGQTNYQAIRYYLNKKVTNVQPILLGNNHPRVEPVNLEKYDRLIGGGSL